MTTSREALAPAPVKAALARALERGEVGVQVAAYHRGRLVVDAWTGRAAAGGAPVDGETLFNIFSVGKGLVAAAVHVQADRGLVDYDAPLARYWPEYARHGKDAITVRHVLMHRSGAPQMPAGTGFEQMRDWPWMIAHLEEVVPAYPAGTHNTYQSMVFGWLCGEIVRRTDPRGRSLAAFVREEILAPLEIRSYFTGLPTSEAGRAATLTYHVEPPDPASDSLLRAAVPQAMDFRPGFYNRPDVRATELSGFGDLANARSVARFFAMVAGGGALGGRRILSEAALQGSTTPRPDYDRPDETYGTGRAMLVGQGGFWIATPDIPELDRRPGQRVLCNPGAGGSIGWADLDNDLAIAICHNRMFTAIDDHPWPDIASAVLAAAGVRRDGPAVGPAGR